MRSDDRWLDTLGTGDLNSHVPMLPLYRDMMVRWNQSVDKSHLTEAEFDSIIGPRVFGKFQSAGGSMQ